MEEKKSAIEKSGYQVQQFNSFDSQHQTSTIALTSEILRKYKETIYGYRASYAHIMQTYGTIPVYDYTKKYTFENRNKILKKRRPEFLTVVKEYIQGILGSAVADSVEKQLKDNNSISTIQHYSPLTHPDVLNSTLFNSLPYFDSDKTYFQNVLVFGCGNVSFNNPSFPKGLLFHTIKDKHITTHQLNFFGHTADARPVIHHQPYKIDAIMEMKKKILSLYKTEEITRDIYEKLLHLLDDVFSSPHILSASSYDQQLVIANYWIWKKMYENYKKQVPNLVFIPQEKIVAKLIQKYHLFTETTLQHMMFGEHAEALMKKYFSNIMGTYSAEEQYGTYLFWYLPKDSKYRIQLWKEGSQLVSSDKKYRLALTPEGINKGLEDNELIPNLLLVYSTLSFYYGMNLGGGRDQIMYLPQMMQAYLAMQQERQDTESIEACSRTITDSFVYPQTALSFLSINDKRIPATGLDLLLYGKGGKNWQNILQATKEITLEELTARLLPNCYFRYCPPDKKDPVFSEITEADIEKFTGIDKKIPVWATLEDAS